MEEQFLRQLQLVFGEQRFSGGLIKRRSTLKRAAERLAGQRMKFAYQLEPLLERLVGRPFDVDGCRCTLEAADPTRWAGWWRFVLIRTIQFPPHRL